MKVKVTKPEETKQEIKYPCLMISEGCIVLFCGKNTGTCLNAGITGSSIGEYSECWAEPLFRPFTGEITLSND